MTTTEIYEQLKRNVRNELYRVHVEGHGDGCPKCIRLDGGATWGGCPVIDEYMVERVINVCNVGLQAMPRAAAPPVPLCNCPTLYMSGGEFTHSATCPYNENKNYVSVNL
jgi:hypothetical protein